MSRLTVLNKIKNNLNSVAKIEHPGVYPQPRIDNQAWLFAEQVKKVGGFIYSAKEEEQAVANLKEKFGDLKNIYSVQNSDFLNTNFKMKFDTKPHDCHILDVLVIKGEIAVAENAAVWVRDPIDFPRAALFLTQHLIVKINVNSIVGSMHEAYKKIQDFTEPFGAFIAGPSKTADVEQCLVIGAHGPRSLTVLLEEF